MHMRGQEERLFSVTLRHTEKFQFVSQAHEQGVLHGAPYPSDEPDPIGDNSGPSTPALLASAVGHCLSASLVETLRHAGIQVISLTTEATAVVAPNAEGNPRIRRIDVQIRPVVDKESRNVQRCIDVFENYCTVCQSIRNAVPVEVKVEWKAAEQPSVTAG